MKGWAKLAKRSLDEADLEYTQICEAEAVRDTSLLGESDDDSSQSSVPLSAQTSDVAWSAESRMSCITSSHASRSCLCMRLVTQLLVRSTVWGNVC